MKALRTSRNGWPIRSLARDRKGAVMVEFGILAVLFIGLLIAVIDVSLMYFADGTLDSSVRKAGRLIRTGQAHEEKLTAAQFKAEICEHMAEIAGCKKNMHVDVTVLSQLADADLSDPVTKDGTLRTTEYYDIGSAGDIIVVQATLPWSPAFNAFSYAKAELADGRALLSATSIFRVEPYN